MEINRYLDHAVLVPEMTQEVAKQAIECGIQYQVKTVCVRPCDIEMAVKMCQGTNTEVSCVLAFPHGNALTASKVFEAEQYCKLGVKEIDMVANYGYIKSGCFEEVYQDIKAVCEVAHKNNVLLKVIVESGVLTLEEVAKATEICIKAKADFIKTSTGFNGGGATVSAVETMVANSNGEIKVKASGGVRDFATAVKFVELGCQRLGNNYTSTKPICDNEQAKTTSGY